ncbi:MAG: hypothetical protein V3W11_02395 [bacterium]
MNRMISLALALALLPLSCGEEEGITRPPIPVTNPVYPADVIENVEHSFNQRDIVLLKRCLSRDFVFYFDPDDVGQNPPGSTYVIPTSWSYTEFWSAANRLFTMAYAISLNIPTSRIGVPSEKETSYKVEDVPISLLVMVNELNGFIADGGYCNFAFGAYYNEKEGKRWRLTGWWDFTSVYADEAPGLEPTSLGKILALYK